MSERATTSRSKRKAPVLGLAMASALLGFTACQEARPAGMIVSRFFTLMVSLIQPVAVVRSPNATRVGSQLTDLFIDESSSIGESIAEGSGLESEGEEGRFIRVREMGRDRQNRNVI